MRAALPHSSSSIPTIRLVPEFHRVSGGLTAAGRGLYRQWGIAPRPEDKGFSCFLRVVYDTLTGNATPNFKKFRRRRTAKEYIYGVSC